ncbi:3'(2'),5'-bisphosphate nucleotidase CysQ [Salinimicrobium sediminilitoris]|uniref:3'(2'),5'-bisphosphate nucleotidase CysQ n=1 Tax=Salinimicrobium sediminilitoris TaxID=2876715 RepID=UPI001E5856FE|nr:3'(2'),5'-bisphosphate nucleotidase CysQ [Salinimicrobium sediminilitoris]MCC8358464.1 3'(2'),5'-bisphosphate nucleotidase CysQ [Salinimicrobium sediminilitoris]
MRQLLEVAIQASLAAGKRIMEIYNNEDFEIEAKGDDSPLTKADLASHDIIMEYLRETNIPVLSEEGKDLPYEERKQWSELWIVDPIDGTKEFIKRNGEFTVNIALVKDQVPVMGVIYVPALKELYFAEKATGSYKLEGITEFSGMEEIAKTATKLPQTTNNKPYTVVASKSHLSPETEEYIKELQKELGEVNSISKGSSLKLCMVAEGQADCYPRFAPTMEWDTAAGQAICMYAGKTVTDYTTKKEMLYNRENLLNNWFLVK